MSITKENYLPNSGDRDRDGNLGLRQSDARSLGSATEAVTLPQPEPGAVGQLFIMPSIRSRQIARAWWPSVRRGENALQGLDLGDDLLNIHLWQYTGPACTRKQGSQRGPGHTWTDPVALFFNSGTRRVLFQLPIQRRLANAEQSGRFQFVAIQLRNRVQNGLPLQF